MAGEVPAAATPSPVARNINNNDNNNNSDSSHSSKESSPVQQQLNSSVDSGIAVLEAETPTLRRRQRLQQCQRILQVLQRDRLTHQQLRDRLRWVRGQNGSNCQLGAGIGLSQVGCALDWFECWMLTSTLLHSEAIKAHYVSHFWITKINFLVFVADNVCLFIILSECTFQVTIPTHIYNFSAKILRYSFFFFLCMGCMHLRLQDCGRISIYENLPTSKCKWQNLGRSHSVSHSIYSFARSCNPKPFRKQSSLLGILHVWMTIVQEKPPSAELSNELAICFGKVPLER